MLVKHSGHYSPHLTVEFWYYCIKVYFQAIENWRQRTNLLHLLAIGMEVIKWNECSNRNFQSGSAFHFSSISKTLNINLRWELETLAIVFLLISSSFSMSSFSSIFLVCIFCVCSCVCLWVCVLLKLIKL